MSTKKERGRMADIVKREFQAYAGALTAAGYDWAAVWETGVDSWPSGTELRWLHGRFTLAHECAVAAGVPLRPEEIVRLYREHLAYVELFPSGMPALTDH